MKKILFISSLALCAILTISCEEDDAGPNVEFIDQIAQGKINGKDWVMASGTGEVRFGDDANLDFTLTDTDYSSPCNVFIIDGLLARFIVTNSTGLKSLNSGARAVLLFDPNNNDNVSNYASKNGIEIVSIGATSITGKIDAYADDDNYINGNFTVDFCED